MHLFNSFFWFHKNAYLVGNPRLEDWYDRSLLQIFYNFEIRLWQPFPAWWASNLAKTAETTHNTELIKLHWGCMQLRACAHANSKRNKGFVFGAILGSFLKQKMILSKFCTRTDMQKTLSVQQDHHKNLKSVAIFCSTSLWLFKSD